MDLQSIKNIPVTLIMEWYHIPVEKKSGNSAFYFAPWREERTPSLKADTVNNLWIDYAEPEKSGSCIDLIMHLERCSFKEACKILEQKSNGTDFSFHRQQANTDQKKEIKKPGIQILSVEPITNPDLIAYIEARKVSVDLAKKYLHQIEIEFTQTKQTTSVLGLRNRNDGYEFRALNFKGCFAPKDVSFIDLGSRILCVVEGMFDMLCGMSMEAIIPQPTNWLTLNSVAMANVAQEILVQHDYVYLLLDNDKAGKGCAKLMLKMCLDNNIKVLDLSEKYQNFKDIADWHMFNVEQQFKIEKLKDDEPVRSRGRRL